MLTRIALGLMWLLRFLPLALLAPAGRAFGMCLYLLAAERRNVVRVNLGLCFPGWDADRRESVVRRHFQAFGRSLLERAVLWWSSRDRILALARIDGLEHLSELRGKPVILLAPHFVGLDVGWGRLACEQAMVSIYSNQKNPSFNAALLKGRLRFGGVKLFSRQDGVRPVLAAMRAGLPLYYLPDLDYGTRDTIFAPFFGVPAATVTALSRIVRVNGAAVLPCVTRQLPGAQGYVVQLHEPWPDFPGSDIEADTIRMNAFIEQCVLEMPEQYFWLHKRFKTRPEGEARYYD